MFRFLLDQNVIPLILILTILAEGQVNNRNSRFTKLLEEAERNAPFGRSHFAAANLPSKVDSPVVREGYASTISPDTIGRQRSQQNRNYDSVMGRSLATTLAPSRVASPVSRRGYGESCNQSTRCAVNSQFACIDEKCQCSKPDQMVYDPITSKCLVSSGEKCKYAVIIEREPKQRSGLGRQYNRRSYEGNDDNDYDSETEFSSRTSYEILPCVSNSVCLNDGCTCNPGFFENAGGLCESKKNLGGNCTTDNECVVRPGIKCIEGICECDPSSSVRNSVGQCVGLPTMPCVNSECSGNSHCVGGRCACAPGFAYDDEEKSCKVKFGGKCDYSEECSGSLECLSGVCNCPYTNHQLFDGDSKCISIVSAPCKQDQDCVPHASCGNNGYGASTCKCSEGFVDNGGGFCLQGHGMPCHIKSSKNFFLIAKSSRIALNLNTYDLNPNAITNVVVGDGCDSSRNLFCRNGSCSCEPDMEMFDEVKGGCVGLAGALCNLQEGSYCGNYSTCTSTNEWNKGNELGTCTCIQSNEIILGEGRRCVKDPSGHQIATKEDNECIDLVQCHEDVPSIFRFPPQLKSNSNQLNNASQFYYTLLFSTSTFFGF